MTYTAAEFAANVYNKDDKVQSWQPGEGSNCSATLDPESFFRDMIVFENSPSAGAGGNAGVDGVEEMLFPESYLAGLDGIPIIPGSSAADLLDFHDMHSQAATTVDTPGEPGMTIGLELVAEKPGQFGRQPQGQERQQWQKQPKVGSPEPKISITQAPETSYKHSISDAELLKLEGISLQSPGRLLQGFASSPSQPSSTLRQPKFLDAVSTTIKRAAGGVRSPTEQRTEGGNGSPVRDIQRWSRRQSPPRPSLRSVQIPPLSTANAGAAFVSGFVEDPFSMESNSTSIPAPWLWASQDSVGMLQQQHGPEARKATIPRSVSMAAPSKPSWPVADTEGSSPWLQQDLADLQAELDGLSEPALWRADPLQELSTSPARDASRNLAQRMSPTDLSYDFNNSVSANNNGTTIDMPQPRQLQQGVLYDLTLSAAAFLPLPTDQSPQHSPNNYYRYNERTRPPPAPSSSARNMSTPMHRTRTRSESSSPSPAHGRHSSGESRHRRTPSDTSLGPSSIRKRRPSRVREPRTQSAGGIGFVNFTPHDSQMLMTGVAASGSSKTKAKREREAIERRRKLGEAAMKAVEAAGGDVEKLAAEEFMAY